MNHYKIEVTRDGKWWMISIPDLDGLTQARRISEIEDMAREYIAVTTGTRLDEVAISHIEIEVGDIDAGVWAEAIREERDQAAELASHALEESRRLARELAERQVPVRDIGELLGVTFQRASQLVNS